MVYVALVPVVKVCIEPSRTTVSLAPPTHVPFTAKHPPVTFSPFANVDVAVVEVAVM